MGAIHGNHSGLEPLLGIPRRAPYSMSGHYWASVREIMVAGRSLLTAPAHLWTGRALQEESSLDGHAVRINLSGLCLELGLRAIMEIRAQLSSLDPRPQGAMCGARLQLCRGDRCSIVFVSSREPRRGLNCLLLGSDDYYAAFGVNAASYPRA